MKINHFQSTELQCLGIDVIFRDLVDVYIREDVVGYDFELVVCGTSTPAALPPVGPGVIIAAPPFPAAAVKLATTSLMPALSVGHPASIKAFPDRLRLGL